MSNQEWNQWRVSRTKRWLDTIATIAILWCGAVVFMILTGLEFWSM